MEINRGFEFVFLDLDDFRLLSYVEVKVGVSELRESYRVEKDCEFVWGLVGVVGWFEREWLIMGVGGCNW